MGQSCKFISTNGDDWKSIVPMEIWYKLEDFGYFPKDISLYDALAMAKYILMRMESGDQEDYYTLLAQENLVEFTRIKKELNAFINIFKGQLYTLSANNQWRGMC